MPKHAIIVQSYLSNSWACFTHMTNLLSHAQLPGAVMRLIFEVLPALSSVCNNRSVSPLFAEADPQKAWKMLCAGFDAVSCFLLLFFLEILKNWPNYSLWHAVTFATRVQSSSDTSFMMILIVINIRFSYLSEGPLLVSRKLWAFLMSKQNFLWMAWEWMPQQKGKEFAEVTIFFPQTYELLFSHIFVLT